MAERTEPPPQPPDLGGSGADLWESVTGIPGLVFRADELAVVETACRVADEISALESTLDGEPKIVDGSKQQKVLHPAISELRLQRQLLSILLGKLQIPERDGDGEWDGLTASERARKAAFARHNGGKG